MKGDVTQVMKSPHLLHILLLPVPLKVSITQKVGTSVELR